jgi:RNA polymerase-interacting CarD/CdnL/TRCF family regulator
VALRLPAAAQVEELLAVLRAPTGEQEETWSRSLKANQEKLRIGDLFVTAGVVRDLTRRQEVRGLSLGEKDQLEHARVPILAELTLALSLADEEAEGLLAPAIHGEQDTGVDEDVALAHGFTSTAEVADLVAPTGTDRAPVPLPARRR